jgi:hypothetical protein
VKLAVPAPFLCPHAGHWSVATVHCCWVRAPGHDLAPGGLGRHRQPPQCTFPAHSRVCSSICSGCLELACCQQRVCLCDALPGSQAAGATPLYLACEGGHLGCASALLACGADASLATEVGLWRGCSSRRWSDRRVSAAYGGTLHPSRAVAHLHLCACRGTPCGVCLHGLEPQPVIGVGVAPAGWGYTPRCG